MSQDPSEDEKRALAERIQLTMTQVNVSWLNKLPAAAAPTSPADCMHACIEQERTCGFFSHCSPFS